jgi:hypothetical protein
VGPKPVWMRWRREKVPYICRGSNPGRPAHSLVTILSYPAPTVGSIQHNSSVMNESTFVTIKVHVLNQAPRHEGVLGEWKYSSTHSLTSALDGGEWSASRLGRFTRRERAPGTHWIGGWVGSRAVLEAVVKRKIPSPRRESKPRTPIVQPVVQRYTDLYHDLRLSSLYLHRPL